MHNTAPVRTGALKASIEAKKNVVGRREFIMTGADYGTSYGGYVEKYRPYIRPSYAGNYKNINGIMKRLGAKRKRG